MVVCIFAKHTILISKCSNTVIIVLGVGRGREARIAHSGLVVTDVGIVEAVQVDMAEVPLVDRVQLPGSWVVGVDIAGVPWEAHIAAGEPVLGMLREQVAVVHIAVALDIVG